MSEHRAAKPNDDGYWVEPGAFFAGAYPGHRDAQRARRKLSAFLEAGIGRFLDLTTEGELSPYAALLEAEAASRGRPVRYRRFPVANLGVPSAALMRCILDEIGAARAAAEPIFVHCWGGIGRTGTVVGCYLVEHGLDGEAALDRIAELRRGLDKATYVSPETPEQREMVRRWFARERVLQSH